ncbi:MAG: hypothetical protein U1F65_05880 [Verrucomicrobiota bacterium]
MTPREKPDLVIGCNHGYPWQKIAPFVESLRQTGFTGDLVLFTGGLSEATEAEIRSHGVLTRPLNCPRLGGSDRWMRHWPTLRRLPQAVKLKLLPCIAPLGSRRFFLYQRFLENNASRYRRVLLTDIRDVVFQKNPFDADWPRGLHVFAEDASHTISSRPINADWVRRAFGEDGFRQLGSLPILCAGTILGDLPSLQDFLQHFCRTCTEARQLDSEGIDQGIFNMAVRTYRGQQVFQHPNGSSAVLTMAIMSGDDLQLNSEGYLTQPDGRIIPVLHQFDRHPEWLPKIKVLQRPG